MYDLFVSRRGTGSTEQTARFEKEVYLPWYIASTDKKFLAFATNLLLKQQLLKRKKKKTFPFDRSKISSHTRDANLIRFDKISLYKDSNLNSDFNFDFDSETIGNYFPEFH